VIAAAMCERQNGGTMSSVPPRHAGRVIGPKALRLPSQRLAMLFDNHTVAHKRTQAGIQCPLMRGNAQLHANLRTNYARITHELRTNYARKFHIYIRLSTICDFLHINLRTNFRFSFCRNIPLALLQNNKIFMSYFCQDPSQIIILCFERLAIRQSVFQPFKGF